MIKKILFVAAVAISAFGAQAQAKIGNVNSQEIFTLMPEVKAAETTLNEVQTKYQNEYKALQDEFDKKFNEYQALDKETPDAIRQRREGELQELQTKIHDFSSVAAQDMQQQQQRLMAPIQEKIMTAIKAVGEENGFTYILDVNSGTIVYTGKDAIDVTPLVKDKLGLKDAPIAPAK